MLPQTRRISGHFPEGGPPVDREGGIRGLSIPGREVSFEPGRWGPAMGSQVGVRKGGNWGGFELHMANTVYSLASMDFFVPPAHAQANSPAVDGAWTGVGDRFHDGLIQDGIEIVANGFAASYYGFHQYFFPSNPNDDACVSGACFLSLSINPGDEIYTEAWAC